MSGPLLFTKFYIPPPRPGFVPRPRLIDRMNDGLAKGCRLTLVSAPAGFGKTTLVSDWISSCSRPVAWVSLDQGDNDPARFITYLVKALQTIKPGVGEELLAVLQSPQPLQIETILTALVNEIASLPQNFITVLDDYHAIDSPPVDQTLAFLIEHQPPQMHLLIATREDPSLPLSRLRARGQIIELRLGDLRFTPAEAAEFLNRVMGLDLSDGDIAALEARTEGWIAGLQLAAVSMQGNKDTAGFIQSFTGSHRFIMEYLLEEVLNRQPDGIKTFLLRTSILDRMCGPLCDAILLDPSVPGQETIEFFERTNLFTFPLDNERCWYRYHQLFCDLLRKRLGQNLAPREVAALHIRASQWYENQDLVLDAFRHAAAAQDIDRAVLLIESPKIPLHLRGATSTILDWLETLPDDVRDAHPELWCKQAELFLTVGRTMDVEQKLQAAEAAVALAVNTDAQADQAVRYLIGKIAVTRANLAQMQLQVETISEQARRALEYLPSDDLSHRSSAACALGYAYYWQGDWEGANRAYVEALSLARTAGDIPDLILALIRLAQLQKDQNKLHLAAENYHQALHLFGDYSNPNAIIAYLGLTEVFYKWNDLDAAEQYALQGLKLARQYDQVHDRIIMSQLHLALIKLARGELSRAAKLVSQAEQTAHQRYYTPRQPNISYFKAWIFLQQGNLDAVAALASQNDLPLMQARVFIRQNDSSRALELLEPIRQEAVTHGMTARLIGVMAVQSVALYAHDEKEKAFDFLAELLALTEPEGCIRPFLEEGQLMMSLLSDYRHLVEDQPRYRALVQRSYLDKILIAFEGSINSPQSQIGNLHTKMADPLTSRELEVLQLIAEGLTNQEICQRLFLALDTVKGHNRRIFEKLQVGRRTEAIARARELSLI